MGSSQKKKKEKQKDFKVSNPVQPVGEFCGLTEDQKPKLKVGKTKAKPDNFTDTSFKSKGQYFLHPPAATIALPANAHCSDCLDAAVPDDLRTIVQHSVLSPSFTTLR